MTPLSSLTPFVDVLPPTAQGKARAFKFWADLPGHGYAIDFAFVVEQQGKPGPEPYAVHEFSAAGGRAFRVFKAGEGESPDPLKAEPYSVFCSDRGPAWDSCSCASGCYRAADPCRHRLVLRQALDNGWIAPLPEDVPGEPEGYTDEELEALAAEYAAEEAAGRCVVA